MNFFTIITQAGSFIAAFAAISAGIIMINVKKRFGTGILASGFNVIAFGVLFFAGGIILETAQTYIPNLSDSTQTFLSLIKEILFVSGTYMIVAGSKRIGDKLESLTK